ncbi:TetR family transcriptional regulator [Anopheles sinensis]|uniref:TetR family transcriptional regulator n=1 Tax=Anopheles sinensis TaxID=74873 RepID=A0A084WP75_ANOSI|nr:TetR family transcriptional regulator [Anopheles sinensis]
MSPVLEPKFSVLQPPHPLSGRVVSVCNPSYPQPRAIGADVCTYFNYLPDFTRHLAVPILSSPSHQVSANQTAVAGSVDDRLGRIYVGTGRSVGCSGSKPEPRGTRA